MDEKKQGGEKRKRHGDYSAFYRKPKPGAKKRSPGAPARDKYKPDKVKSGGYLREEDDGLIRLNKYLADAGICSRREADKLIASGTVKVNGKVVTELGTKVSPTDKVMYGGETLRREKLRYLVLNKPKDFITTTDDPQERKTVMNLVEKACPERIYPVGRLDRMTTGVLLFTNDGELAKKLTHPRHGIRKIYHVVLHKQLTKADFEKITTGIELDDGPIKVDKLSWIEDGKIKKEVGLELHSGRNRIVRRIFESLGYKVVRLDRVVFAGITKKDTPRGKWRMLTEAEVNMLKRLPK
jgi:23S rRNA pseudouridine2605 synthase